MFPNVSLLKSVQLTIKSLCLLFSLLVGVNLDVSEGGSGFVMRVDGEFTIIPIVSYSFILVLGGSWWGIVGVVSSIRPVCCGKLCTYYLLTSRELRSILVVELS